MTVYTPDTLEGLQEILKGLDDGMAVEADADCVIEAKTVGELKQIKSMPHVPVRVTISHPIYPESAVKIAKRDPS